MRQHIVTSLCLAAALVACSGDSTSSSSFATLGGDDGGGGDAPASSVAKICQAGCSTVADCQNQAIACVAGACIQCQTDADCVDAGTGVGCDRTTGQCLACKADSDCSGSLTGKCSPLGQCNGCTTDADCATLGDSTQALCVAHSCVGCRTTADCGGSGACDTTTGQCTGCATSDDCCSSSGVSPCPLSCNTALGRCECQTGDQCTRAFPEGGVEACLAAGSPD
jgi:hypothetical protein